MGAMTFTDKNWNQPLILFLDLVFALFALGLYDPRRYEWALRSVSGILCVGFSALFAQEFLLPGKPRQHDYFQGLHLLFLFIIPAGIYAVRGFPRRKKLLNRVTSDRDGFPPAPINPK